MKKLMVSAIALSLLLVGCSAPQDAPAKSDVSVSASQSQSAGETSVVEPAEPAEPTQPAEPALTVTPLPDYTMDNLTDATLAISMGEGDAYLDDTGVLRMDLKIYSYDMYDAVDLAMIKEGDVISGHNGDIVVLMMERTDTSLIINGGLEEGGMELVSGGGVFYEVGFNDAKSWYEVGEATIRVSTEFIFHDNYDPAVGEITHYPGSFLIDEVTNFDFTPLNTTIRVVEGQIVEMDRIFVP